MGTETPGGPTSSPLFPKEHAMRVIRVLVYEGTNEFIQKSLTQRTVVGRMPGAPGNSIKEFYLSAPIPFTTDPPAEFAGHPREEP